MERTLTFGEMFDPVDVERASGRRQCPRAAKREVVGRELLEVKLGSYFSSLGDFFR